MAMFLSLENTKFRKLWACGWVQKKADRTGEHPVSGDWGETVL